MGHTIWVLKSGQQDDDWDHSLMLREEKTLKSLAIKLGLKDLTGFYDYSILAEEYDGPQSEPHFVSPDELKATLQGLINAIRVDSCGISDARALLEELEDCLQKTTQAMNDSSEVRLSIVP